MTTTNPMIEGRRTDSARRRERVLKALRHAARNGTAMSVSAIARAAGVDRTFLYRHRDLLTQIHAASSEPPGTDGTGPLVSRASLQADLASANDRAGRQAAQIRQLEHKIAELLGEQVWHESGIGAPADIEQLHRRITALEQQLVDLTAQLDERAQELEAARAANRELMTRLNTRSQPAGLVHQAES
ncbi:DUF6262 family protein [Kitasatospora aureofaciens]|uniref:Uncharacterized protein n=2 Tax=Kitasatospora aureofaciens TaxID=1894 RepID=A0A8H9LVB5_KITAU|nr:DUF6262 family protein [Kitasatospora aureofaciens]ARF81694.1 hypothetical protein B6264_24830 [Kitasatospora aureofaciens]GGV00996.1 hypothetical protein GCM10010502_64370 [Kitasatospora aureofaciens]